MPNDTTGIETFDRYLWQAKMATLTWLRCTTTTGPIAVVLEMVEDLVVVERDLLRFAQLKTRDRGSWTANKICAPGHAVDKLAKSYLAAKAAKIVDVSRFEVWLEGPASDDPKTRGFFLDPRNAHADLRTKLVQMGLRGKVQQDFLERLLIKPQHPSRQTIDAVIMRAIGATWPGLQHAQIVELYEKLLLIATSAQAATEPPSVVQSAIAAGRLAPPQSSAWSPIDRQTLMPQKLRAVCPPLSSDTNEALLQRVADGHATLLELKLVRAGATPATVQTAIAARADANISAKLELASGRVDAHSIAELDVRLLAMARSVEAMAQITEASAHNPGQLIFHQLMANPANVVATDKTAVFSGDARLLVGHLCNLSDQCHFGWGRP